MTFLIVLSILIGFLIWLFWPSKKKSSDTVQRRPGNDAPSWLLPLARGGVIVLTIAWILVCTIRIVPAGTAQTGILFGSVTNEVYEQGPHFVNPLLDFAGMSARREILEFQSGGNEAANAGDVIAVSSNNLPLTIDVTFSYVQNPSYAPWLYLHIGDQAKVTRELLNQAARSAVRSATAQFSDTEATTSKRDALALAMENDFRNRLIDDMVRQGLAKEDAEKVFVVIPVQLRKVLPPQKVLNAISEKAASEQDLARQHILTEIATQEALRREQEGKGVTKLFDALPKDFTSTQIAEVLNALANKERADAMRKAVETDHVNVMIMEGATPSVNVPSPAPAAVATPTQ